MKKKQKLLITRKQKKTIQAGDSLKWEGEIFSDRVTLSTRNVWLLKKKMKNKKSVSFDPHT